MRRPRRGSRRAERISANSPRNPSFSKSMKLASTSPCASPGLSCVEMQCFARRWLIGCLLLASVLWLAGTIDARTKPRLGRPPSSCPRSAPLPMSTPPAGWGRLVGTSPLWLGVYAFVNPRRARITVSANRSYRRKRWGWPVKILWVVPREHTAAITISLTRRATGAQVWVRIGGLYNELTKAPVLDPARPGHPDDPARPATHEWGSTVYFPRAGCYSLDASWSGGGERLTFAFGRRA